MQDGVSQTRVYQVPAQISVSSCVSVGQVMFLCSLRASSNFQIYWHESTANILNIFLMFVEESGKLRHRLICPLASVGTAHAKAAVYIFREKLEGKGENKEGNAAEGSPKD